MVIEALANREIVVYAGNMTDETGESGRGLAGRLNDLKESVIPTQKINARPMTVWDRLRGLGGGIFRSRNNTNELTTVVQQAEPMTAEQQTEADKAILRNEEDPDLLQDRLEARTRARKREKGRYSFRQKTALAATATAVVAAPFAIAGVGKLIGRALENNDSGISTGVDTGKELARSTKMQRDVHGIESGPNKLVETTDSDLEPPKVWANVSRPPELADESSITPPKTK